ncbi:MAG: hypothetical protein ACHQVK_03725, partial [Candidatus Paceibacterales bacterium]
SEMRNLIVFKKPPFSKAAAYSVCVIKPPFGVVIHLSKERDLSIQTQKNRSQMGTVFIVRTYKILK